MAQIKGFKGDYNGLGAEQVMYLHEKHGKNELVPPTKETLFKKLIGLFKEPMFILLFGTAFLYFLLGEPRDGVIMLCFVVFMSGINTVQQWRTDKTLQALKELSSPKVTVIRDGIIQQIESTDVAVGDLIIIEEGDKIPADGKIIEQHDLGVDESTLTGESEVVWKTTEHSNNQWRLDYCYAGTMATMGIAIIEITATGTATEYGKIGLAVASSVKCQTPLEKQIKHLITVSAFIGLIMLILVLLVTYINNKNFVESLLSSLTIAMAMIPEEFPVILTVFLAMGAWRLAKQNSLIRSMPSVETLGSVSVLCVDKTGTLTQNKMTIQQTYTYNGINEHELIYWSGLGCETEPYDPMEKGILNYAQAMGINSSDLFKYSLVHEYPFNCEIKMMGHIWNIDGVNSLAAKGSPESILPLCGLDTQSQKVVAQKQLEMAQNGFRVIAVARCLKIDNIPPQLCDNRLELLGLLGIADPPRENVPEAISVCNKASIRVVMITGDNKDTARAIACKIGILNCDNVISGNELEQMSDEQLNEAVRYTNIFARVMPRHKMRIVKALKDIGEIVAMTGDGVNDAPALKYSDIGIAMGKRGTGVAKEAADMILLDDNFETIVKAVKDGRRIYDNIKKAIGYVFVIHIPIALIAFLTPIMRLPLMLLPIHIVLLELIIDPTCSIVFERQAPERDIMHRAPRPANSTLISLGLMTKAILQGLSIFAATFGSYYMLIQGGSNDSLARSFALCVFVISNLMLVYVNQSEKDFAYLGFVQLLKDRVVWLINLTTILALLAVIYIPVVNTITKTQPLDLKQFLLAAGLALAATLWWELVKLFKRLTQK